MARPAWTGRYSNHRFEVHATAGVFSNCAATHIQVQQLTSSALTEKPKAWWLRRRLLTGRGSAPDGPRPVWNLRSPFLRQFVYRENRYLLINMIPFFVLHPIKRSMSINGIDSRLSPASSCHPVWGWMKWNNSFRTHVHSLSMDPNRLILSIFVWSCMKKMGISPVS